MSRETRGNFLPSEKKPAIITSDKAKAYLYGEPGHQVSCWIYVATDKLHFGIYEIPPGGWFEPIDIHGGDEPYYILKGTLTMFQPDTGETYVVQEGDAFNIPISTWHQGYNFTDKPVSIIFAVAPRVDHPDRGRYPGKAKLYKGSKEAKRDVA